MAHVVDDKLGLLDHARAGDDLEAVALVVPTPLDHLRIRGHHVQRSEAPRRVDPLGSGVVDILQSQVAHGHLHILVLAGQECVEQSSQQVGVEIADELGGRPTHCQEL